MDVVRLLATSWPAAAALALIVLGLIFMLLFRSPIAATIPKIRKVGRTGVELAPTPSQEAEKSPLHVAETDPRSAAEELRKALDSPLLVDQENRIKKDLQDRGLAAAKEGIDVLVRYLAVFQMGYAFEYIYGIIWGRQIMLLETLNPLPQRMELATARLHYDAAAAIWPEVYAGYSFDNWIQFLEGMHLITRSGNRILITAAGREFLAYLVRMGKNLVKAY